MREGDCGAWAVARAAPPLSCPFHAHGRRPRGKVACWASSSSSYSPPTSLFRVSPLKCAPPSPPHPTLLRRRSASRHTTAVRRRARVQHGDDALCSLHCRVLPVATNYQPLGPRITMFLASRDAGASAQLLVLSLVDAKWCQTLVIIGGAANGFGAACLWTGQGRLVLEWSDGGDVASLFAVFWGSSTAPRCSAVCSRTSLLAHRLEETRQLWPSSWCSSC